MTADDLNSLLYVQRGAIVQDTTMPRRKFRALAHRTGDEKSLFVVLTPWGAELYG